MKVIYCEWLALGSRIEIEMEKTEALKRYKIKLKALEGFLFYAGSFLGVKTLDNQWIVKNTT